MSHEILLLAGDPSAVSARMRRGTVERAATAIPGVDQIRIEEASHACLALVSTEPSGADLGVISTIGSGFRATVALTTSGLEAASKGTSKDVGSESGHVTIKVTDDESVEVKTDGYATVGTFWARLEGQLLITTHLASLVSLGLPGTVDEHGAIEYLAMLHPLGARTVLSGAFLLQPGSNLTWTINDFEIKESPIFTPGPALGDTSATVAAFRDTWELVIGEAVRRSQPNRALIGLSGGLDSRIIAAQWVRSGSVPVAYTYGDANTHEVRVAEDLAGRLKVPHLQMPVSDQYLLAGADRSPDLLDGAHAPAQMYEVWFGDRLRSVADVIVNGLGGGTLMGDDKLMGIQDPELLLQRAWNRYESDTRDVAELISAEARDDVPRIVKSAIERSLAEHRDLGRSDAGIYWRIANRQFRWGNMFHTALRRIGIRPDTPFLDGRFLAFAARLTPEQRLNGTLYLSVQRSLFPETADLARSDDGNSPRHLDHAYWSGDRRYLIQLAELGMRHPISAARRGYRRATDVATRRLAQAKMLSSFADRVQSAKDVFPAEVFLHSRPDYGARLADSLETAIGSARLLNEAEIERAVNAIRIGDPQHSAVALGKVAALGSWAQDYRRRETDFKDLSESGSVIP